MYGSAFTKFALCGGEVYDINSLLSSYITMRSTTASCYGCVCCVPRRTEELALACTTINSISPATLCSSPPWFHSLQLQRLFQDSHAEPSYLKTAPLNLVVYPTNLPLRAGTRARSDSSSWKSSAIFSSVAVRVSRAPSIHLNVALFLWNAFTDSDFAANALPRSLSLSRNSSLTARSAS